MKSLMILGGLIGFGIGLLFGWIRDNSWSSMLFRACVATYLAGLLLRWWGRVWVKSLEEMLHERQAAATAKPAPAAPANRLKP